jgi:hypothetical protein
MPDYSIFGGCLRSEVVFPELREASGRAATWTLRESPTAPPLSNAEQLGELTVSSTCQVRLLKHAEGYRLAFDDTGTYDVSADGRHITWCPGPRHTRGAVRADVTGRVLSAALHAAGAFCLHGSAVSLPGGTVAFVAPKYHGKSTLAFALARAGGRLVTDDVLPVDPGPPAFAIPGVHQVKLWRDSAEAFGIEPPDVTRGEKQLVSGFPDELLMFERSPLTAIYLLGIIDPETSPEEAARRERLGDVPSALALVRQTAIGELLRGSEAPVLFERAVAVARAVPVYRLERVKGLERMDEVIETLFAWHGRPAAHATVADLVP